MARNINVSLTNFRTGTNVTIQRRLIDITVNWIGADEQTHTATQTVTFPDILADVPAQWIRDELIDLCLRAVRVKLGVDA